MIAPYPCSAAPRSTIGSPNTMGGPSGAPVSSMNPARAWRIGSYAASSWSGPKPVTPSQIRSGLTARSVASSMPSFA